MVDSYHPATPAARGEEHMPEIVDVLIEITSKAAPASLLYEVDGMVCRLTIEVLGQFVKTNDKRGSYANKNVRPRNKKG